MLSVFSKRLWIWCFFWSFFAAEKLYNIFSFPSKGYESSNNLVSAIFNWGKSKSITFRFKMKNQKQWISVSQIESLKFKRSKTFLLGRGREILKYAFRKLFIKDIKKILIHLIFNISAFQLCEMELINLFLKLSAIIAGTNSHLPLHFKN